MSKSIKEIKRESRNRVNNNFGDAFIIVFVPFFIMNALNIIFAQLSDFLPDGIELSTDISIQIILNIFATYMAIKLLITHVRSTDRLSFNNFFRLEKGFYSFTLLRVVVAAILVIMLLPMWSSLSEMFTTISRLVDVPAVEGYLLHSDILTRIYKEAQTSALLVLLFWLLSIRFQMLPFIIVDKNVSLLEAVKISLVITKGNYFKILLFPLTYLLWLLLIPTFIGIFYIIPLITIGYGYLYLSMITVYDNLE
jgi:uncharacterized membrane protein